MSVGKTDQSGFTLIEVMVAFTILSGAILVAFESSSTSFKAIRNAQQKSKAMEILRREVIRFASGYEISPKQGTSRGIHWKIEVRPLGSPREWPSQTQPFLATGTTEPGNAQIETVVVRPVAP